MDDDDDAESRGTRRPAFSGASPDDEGAALPTPPVQAGADRGVTVEAADLLRSGRQVADVVTALFQGDAAPRGPLSGAGSEREAIAAATSATAVLASRLPVLSGVVGAAALVDAGEEPDDLLRSYASLLVTRCSVRGLPPDVVVTREQLTEVAQVAATVAGALLARPGSPSMRLRRLHADELVRRCSTRLPAQAQLAAACLLLAQTARDGAAGPQSLPGEIDDVVT